MGETARDGGNKGRNVTWPVIDPPVTRIASAWTCSTCVRPLIDQDIPRERERVPATDLLSVPVTGTPSGWTPLTVPVTVVPDRTSVHRAFLAGSIQMPATLAFAGAVERSVSATNSRR